MGTEEFLFEIRKNYRNLRPSEQKVADVILEGTEEIAEYTIEQFAHKAKVSQPTVLRFVNAMGMKGYKELKTRMIQIYAGTQKSGSEKMVLDFPIQETDKLVELPAKVIMTNIRHMEECLKSISTYEYIQAVHALHEAQRISVFAVENSACTAEDFATKMTYIGKQVSFQKDGYLQHVTAGSLTSQDVAMGISHTGKSRQTVDALAIAKEAGARTIAITNSETAVINRFADIVLCTENRQYMYGDAIFSRCAQVSIVDMLYLGVFLTDYEQNAKRLNQNWEGIQKLIY